MRKTVFGIVAASLLSVGMASAQTQQASKASGAQSALPALPALNEKAPKAGHTVMYKDKTVYDFDADEVEGTLLKPDSVMVDGRLGARFGSMLKARPSFEPEMLKSVESM